MILIDGDVSFGTLVKTFRRRRRCTQQQLADALGVHRSTLFRWEQGDYLPESKAQVLELARHLKLSDQETRQFLEASLTALAPYWYVPLPRNPYFTGRDAILEELHTQLRADQAVALTQSSALHGLGGIGKTQIALEYAHRYALEYRAVFWIAAETEQQIIASFLHIADELHLPEREEKDQQRAVASVQHWFATHKEWLLIWDNLEDLDLLPRFLPSRRQGAILLTTRRQALSTLAQGLVLSPMEQEEGTLFLLRRAKVLPALCDLEHMRLLVAERPSHYRAAAELVEAMGGLPLALDQAGAYLEETQCGLTAYLKLFGSHRAVLLDSRGEGAQDHPASVSTTLHLAITAAASQHPAVGDLLRMCALLQPDAIPEELFHQAAEHLGGTLAPVGGDVLEWNRVLALASGYSLLARQGEQQTLSVHRLVQAVALDEMQEGEYAQWCTRAIKALDTVFPEVHLAPTSAILRQCERLLPHALWCLQREEDAEAALAVASLACKTAGYLFHYGRYAEDEALYQRALRLREQVLGPDHPLVADVLHGLARLYYEQGRFEQAEPFYQRAISIQENTPGADQSNLAYYLLNLAVLYHAQGRYGQAEPLFRRALSIYEHASGPDHPSRAYALNGLAMLCYEQGQYEQAKPLFQQALSIWEQALGPDHPNVARALHNLAALSYQQGEYEQAGPLFQRALSLWEQALGPGHPRLVYPLVGLADLYREQGAYGQAEPLYQRALSILEQGLGPDDLRTTDVLNGLATLYATQGKYEQAEPLYQRTLSIQERHLGLHNPQIAETLHDLALLRKAQGNLDEAISLSERALTIRVQSLGDAHSKTVTTRALFTQLVQEQERARRGKTHSTRRTEALADGSGEGCVVEQAVVSTQSAAAASAYEDHSFRAFLDACCELHPRAWCRSADLWRAYTRWAEGQQDRYPLSRGAFIARLKSLGCSADRTMSARIWRGIALIQPDRDGP